ncbi:protein of unknown function [Candidatus Nitrosocosmicus franklandus]|uniref:Uncharacterized protein n=1 Tax=Candidatus Nitrosocosmicus franklandianus TaxID=1798806 RepID=A0A484IEE5_9ARCH|nr:protein of unknown function [Candidatus Nitrosocosmicus franklandus]
MKDFKNWIRILGYLYRLDINTATISETNNKEHTEQISKKIYLLYLAKKSNPKN